jgi:hypothetical protein
VGRSVTRVAGCQTCELADDLLGALDNRAITGDQIGIVVAERDVMFRKPSARVEIEEDSATA